MTNISKLYLDDSGVRCPNRRRGTTPIHNHDWFSLGGVFVHNESDELTTRELIAKFGKKWGINAPLHSFEIRHQSQKFSWIGKLSKTEQDNFYEELYQLLREAPVIGIACVIDRPGYNHRYAGAYANRWFLCKTAFNVVVERACKYALFHNSKLKVYIERGDKTADMRIKQYWTELNSTGLPFNPSTSDKYNPLTAPQIRSTLHEIKFKYKTSPLVQLADLYLWPMAMGGYDQRNRTYKRLLADGKLINTSIPPEQIDTMGIKYSCWDLQKTKAP